MKKTKTLTQIIETSKGKYLYRDVRPPIQLRTSPRKQKMKLKKGIKRLNEKNLSSTLNNNEEEQLKKKKKKLERIEKQLSFHSNHHDEIQSILLIVSPQNPNPINKDQLNHSKCK